MFYIYDLPQFPRSHFVGADLASSGPDLCSGTGLWPAAGEASARHLQLSGSDLADDLSTVASQTNAGRNGAFSRPAGDELAAVARGGQTHSRRPDLQPHRWLLPGTAEDAHTGSQQRV